MSKSKTNIALLKEEKRSTKIGPSPSSTNAAAAAVVVEIEDATATTTTTPLSPLPPTPIPGTGTPASKNSELTYTWSKIHCEATLSKAGSKDKLPNKKMLLRGVSGEVQSGEMWALMGSSGAGKTTLLNLLNFRTSKKLAIQGGRFLNGVPVGADVISSISAYVQQDDLFLPLLTVREHLIFSSLVRLPSSVSKKERHARVDEVLKELGLWKSKDAYIGGPTSFKGISGGERKRLAFAAEILTDPKILFCDEPTSGLDSFMAKNVVSKMQNMAARGKIIICTIHQPSTGVFKMFNNLYLLTDGRVAYAGGREEALAFFDSNGYTCPPTHNPADFYIRTLAILPDSEEECRAKTGVIADKFAETMAMTQMSRLELISQKSSKIIGKSQNTSAVQIEQQGAGADGKTTTGKFLKYRVSSWRQFCALTWRSALIMKREPLLFYGRLAQNFSLGVFLATLFYSSDTVYTANRASSISGAIILFVVLQVMLSSFSVICTFPLEVPIFLREHWNGMYRCWIYYLAKTCVDIPVLSLFPFIMYPQYWWMSNMEGPFYRLLLECIALVCVIHVGAAMGYALSTWTSSMQSAIIATPILLSPALLFSGRFVDETVVFNHIGLAKYGSPAFFGSANMMHVQWEPLDIKFEPPPSPLIPALFKSGNDVMVYFNYSPDTPQYENFVGLGVLFLIWRLIALAGLIRKARLS